MIHFACIGEREKKETSYINSVNYLYINYNNLLPLYIEFIFLLRFTQKHRKPKVEFKDKTG